MSDAAGTIALMIRSERAKFAGLWLLIGLIAAAACSLTWPSAHFADEYVPFSNDSFYHARRILDTVADPASFYEFDSKIHAPEGSLLTWPWGYDYAMAWLVRAGLALGISGSPIGILIWLPVLAVFVSMGLMLLLARRLGLQGPWSSSPDSRRHCRHSRSTCTWSDRSITTSRSTSSFWLRWRAG